jgi:hypothetical protein
MFCDNALTKGGGDFFAILNIVLQLFFLVKLHGLSPRVNYTDRATATCRRSDCQLVRIEGETFLNCCVRSAFGFEPY